MAEHQLSLPRLSGSSRVNGPIQTGQVWVTMVRTRVPMFHQFLFIQQIIYSHDFPPQEVTHRLVVKMEL